MTQEVYKYLILLNQLARIVTYTCAIANTVKHDYKNKNTYPFRLYYLLALYEAKAAVATFDCELISGKMPSPDVANYMILSQGMVILLVLSMWCLGNASNMNLPSSMDGMLKKLCKFTCIYTVPSSVSNQYYGLYTFCTTPYFIFTTPLLVEEHIRYILYRKYNNLKAINYEKNKLKDVACPPAHKPIITESIVLEGFKWPFVPQYYLCGTSLRGGFLNKGVFISSNNSFFSEAKTIVSANTILEKYSGHSISFDNKIILSHDLRSYIYEFLKVKEIANLNRVAKSLHGTVQDSSATNLHRFFSVKSEISAFMSLVSEIDAKLESENTDNAQVKKYNFYGIHSPLAKALCDLLTKEGVNNIYNLLQSGVSINQKSCKFIIDKFHHRCPGLHKTIMHGLKVNNPEAESIYSRVNTHFVNSKKELPKISRT